MVNMKTISINDEDYNIIRARAKEDGRTLAGFIHVLLLSKPAQIQTFPPVFAQDLDDTNQHITVPYKPVLQSEMSEAELRKTIAARDVS